MTYTETTNNLGLIHNLGGCGGTLLAQCLGTQENVIILSECNPMSAHLYGYNLNPYQQIKEWHPELFSIVENQFTPESMSDEATFCEFIGFIKSYLEKNNKKLIVRDYNYIDYLGVPFLDKPRLSSSLVSSLKDNYSTLPVVLVRHPLTQYNSLRTHDDLKNILSPDIFLKGQKKFKVDFEGCQVIKYEDIVSNPVESISHLCSYLGIKFSEKSLDKFYDNISVTGNLKRADEKTISFTKTPIIEDKWTADLQKHPDFSILLESLGYQ